MTDVYANQTEKGDAVSLVRNASSCGNKVGVTTYAAIRDCNLALQRLRLPEHRISEKSTERGSLHLARSDAIILTCKTIVLSSDFNDRLYKGGCECVCNTYVKTKISHLHRMSSLL